jgi:RNA polymerase sigma-70 factor (ECF subfamily)
MMPLTSIHTDVDLLAGMERGEEAAFTALYRRHQGLIYRFALLWSGAAATAADVTQEVFMHLLTRADDYDPRRGSLSAYLCGVARNFVRRHATRRWDTLPEAPGEDDDALCPAAWIDPVTPADLLLQRQESESLHRAILRLPPHYRDVLVLCELQECSYAETAAICGCELGTVRSRLSRARTLLANELHRVPEPAAQPGEHYGL